MSTTTPEAGTITMFTTTWCGYCRRLKTLPDREGISYTEVNIEQDPDSATFVEQANGGNQTVPTLVYADGTPGTSAYQTPVVVSTRTVTAVPTDCRHVLGFG